MGSTAALNGYTANGVNILQDSDIGPNVVLRSDGAFLMYVGVNFNFAPLVVSLPSSKTSKGPRKTMRASELYGIQKPNVACVIS